MKRSPKLYNKFKLSYCLSCGHNGSFYPLDIDHVITFKSHPELQTNRHNCATLCRRCHQIKGQQGLNYLASNSPTFKIWLDENGWYFDEFLQKWRLELLGNPE